MPRPARPGPCRLGIGGGTSGPPSRGLFSACQWSLFSRPIGDRFMQQPVQKLPVLLFRFVFDIIGK